VALFCNPAAGGTFSRVGSYYCSRTFIVRHTAIAGQFALAGQFSRTVAGYSKASEKTPKGVIPPSLCEISQNASRKKRRKKRDGNTFSVSITLFSDIIFFVENQQS
jgi:hypothetical protein